jgi:hypothetical protein
MPTSSPLGKEDIKEWFESRLEGTIKSIVDVGAGEGTYRKLLGPSYHWTAIEAWPDYIERFGLRNLYDVVVVGDVRTMVLPDADCIIFGDVVEHFIKEEGCRLLQEAVSRYAHVVVSIPIGEYVQGPIDGNAYEEHLSTWGWDELVGLIEPSLELLLPYHPTCPPDLGIGVFCR